MQLETTPFRRPGGTAELLEYVALVCCAAALLSAPFGCVSRSSACGRPSRNLGSAKSAQRSGHVLLRDAASERPLGAVTVHISRSRTSISTTTEGWIDAASAVFPRRFVGAVTFASGRTVSRVTFVRRSAHEYMADALSGVRILARQAAQKEVRFSVWLRGRSGTWSERTGVRLGEPLFVALRGRVRCFVAWADSGVNSDRPVVSVGHVLLQGGSITNLNVSFTGWRRVSGCVVDGRGRPVVGARVVVVHDARLPLEFWVRVSPQHLGNVFSAESFGSHGVGESVLGGIVERTVTNSRGSFRVAIGCGSRCVVYVWKRGLGGYERLINLKESRACDIGMCSLKPKGHRVCRVTDVHGRLRRDGCVRIFHLIESGNGETLVLPLPAQELEPAGCVDLSGVIPGSAAVVEVLSKGRRTACGCVVGLGRRQHLVVDDGVVR